MRRSVATLAGLGLVALAFLASHTEPESETSFAPFATRAELGERVDDGDLIAQVDAVRLADTVRLGEDDWTGTTTGVWLVVDVQLVTVRDPSSVYGLLRVGDRSWETTGRMVPAGSPTVGISPGLPMAGSLVFEIPAGLPDAAAAGSAVLQLATDLDARLSPVVELGVDLRELPHERELRIERPERVIW